MADFNVGDMVRISYEGKVIEGAKGELNIQTTEGNKYYFLVGDHKGRTIEILERAEIPWQDGDVAYSKLGTESVNRPMIAMRDGGRWYYATGAVVHPTTSPEGGDSEMGKSDWKPLIRGGKRVVNK